jgi:hypothetical protein
MEGETIGDLDLTENQVMKINTVIQNNNEITDLMKWITIIYP